MWALVCAAALTHASTEGSAWGMDTPQERIAFHYVDGTIGVYLRGRSTPLVEVLGPLEVQQLLLEGDTLVAVGGSGVWAWTVSTGQLRHHIMEIGPVDLSEDGHYLATAHLLVAMHRADPLMAWPAAEQVQFSEDSRRVATLHHGRPVLRLIPRPRPAP